MVAYRAFSDVAGKGAFLVITLVAARRMSQEAFGLFSLGTTIGWMAAVAADFGIQLHTARAIATRPTQAEPILRSWLRVRLWTTLAALAVVGAGVAFFQTPAGTPIAILLLVGVYLLSGLVEFLHYVYRGLSRTDIESTLTLWQRAGTLLLALAILWWRPDVRALAVAMLLPVAATFWYSRRVAFRLAAASSSGTPEDTLEPLGSALRSILPTGAGILLSAFYFRVDVLLIDVWAGPSAVGLYNAAFRIVEALRLFPAAVLAVALPVLFRASSRGPLVAVSALVTAGASGAAIVLWMSAGWLIPLAFGERFIAAVPAFRVLLLAFPLMSLNYALTHQLVGWRGHRAYAMSCAAALVFNVVLNARLIPSAGIVGAAWSTVWTEAVITAACLVALARIDPAAGLLHPAESEAAS